jgi:hypothetical protein
VNSPPEVAAEPAPASPWRRRLGFLAGLLVLVFLGVALVDGWSAVSAYNWELQPGLLAMGCAVLLLFYLASGVGYIAIIDRLHGGGPPGLVMLDIWGRSLLGRYVPGNVLMVVGRVVLSYERGVPRRSTVAAMVYEQVLTVAVGAAGAVAFVAIYSGGGDATLWLLALLPFGLILLLPRFFGPATAYVLRRFGREPLPRLLETRALLALLGWYTLTAVLLGLGIWLLILSAAGSEAGDPAYIGLAFLLSFAVSMVAFIFPSGLGVREGVFALALAQNLPGSVAVALSVGVRLMLTLVELAFIGVVYLIARRR